MRHGGGLGARPAPAGQADAEKAIVANQLPALPEVAHRLLDCFRREDVSLVELSELIARDSALAARVLRLLLDHPELEVAR